MSWMIGVNSIHSEYSNVKAVITQLACASGSRQENGISSTDYLKINNTQFIVDVNDDDAYSMWNFHVSYTWNI